MENAPAELEEIIAEVEENRRTSGNFRYPIREMLTIVFLAMTVGLRSSRKFELWGKANIEELRKRGLELKNGIPSHYTFSRLFRKMPPRLLKKLMKDWSEPLRDLDYGSVVAVDGKALKHASPDGVHTPYEVTAWVSETGFSLGEVKTDIKSNEIKAIPELMKILGDDIEGCTVTIDAAGCQKEIAAIVVDVNKADYVFGLKDNQKTFHDEFLELFDHAIDAYPDRFRAFESVEKNSGRFERRKCIQTDYVEWFEDLWKWKGLKTVVLVESERKTSKGTSTDRRLYASSLPMNPKRALKCIRQHWGIENGLHWTMDVIFDEDRSRYRLDHGPENMSVFRHILVSVLKQKARRFDVSVDTLCAMAVADKEFLFDLFFGKKS